MVSAWEVGRQRSPADKSTSELVATLSDDLRRLLRAETRLAVTEITRKARRAGLGAGALVTAGAFALLGGAALAACAALALARVLPSWLAALLVAAGLLILAGLTATIGLLALRAATPPLPTWSATSVREDIDVLRQGIHSSPPAE